MKHETVLCKSCGAVCKRSGYNNVHIRWRCTADPRHFHTEPKPALIYFKERPKPANPTPRREPFAWKPLNRPDFWLKRDLAMTIRK